jgi:hypothetical protein
LHGLRSLMLQSGAWAVEDALAVGPLQCLGNCDCVL